MTIKKKKLRHKVTLNYHSRPRSTTELLRMSTNFTSNASRTDLRLFSPLCPLGQASPWTGNQEQLPLSRLPLLT